LVADGGIEPLGTTEHWALPPEELPPARIISDRFMAKVCDFTNGRSRISTQDNAHFFSNVFVQ
jgi:hypothetical protein